MRLDQIGAAIRKRREDLGLTVREAAARVSIGKAQWSAIENGASSNIPRIRELLDALELEADVTVSVKGTALPEDRRELLQMMENALPHLTDRDVQILRSQLPLFLSDEGSQK